MATYKVICIKGHKRTFRMFGNWRRTRFYRRHVHLDFVPEGTFN